MNIRFFGILIGLIVLATACEKQKELDLGITPGNLKGKLKSFIQNKTETGKTIKTEFSYTENERIDKIKITNTQDGYNSEENFTYGTDGKVISSKYILTQNTSTSTYLREYTTDKNGLITQVKETKESAPEVNYIFYTYSGDGKIIEYMRRQISGNSNRYQGGATLSWKNGNVVLLNETFRDGLIEEIDYLYDDKKNPVWSIYNEFLKIPTTDISYLSQNNQTFIKKFFEGSKFKIESIYDETQVLTSQKISVFRNSDYVKTQENIFEYYK
jgi:hypothetical protein